jgi:hypothetical protein
MTPKVQVGTILIEERPLIAQVLGLESEPYSGNWSMIKGLDGFSLDRKIHTAGWNFFFIATELKVMIFGATGATNIHSALKRILEKVRRQNFNCFEVTGIVAKRFLGRAVCHRFRTLTPCPTELHAGWRPRTADGAKQEARG